MNQRNIKIFEGGALSHSLYGEIVSVENLFFAWKEFRKGKRGKADVGRFEFTLEDNIFKLHGILVSGTYVPDKYEAFYVKDPKLRHIHKASVRDRLVHQALFRKLYPIFDRHFIYDSYSSREYKGTHRGVLRLEGFIRKTTRNWTSRAWILKCDVRKFFDSIDHCLLIRLVEREIEDVCTRNLIRAIIQGFEKSPGKGLPLGNVTSQLFANVYLNELDHFAKHVLGAKYYARYCDDFVLVHADQYVLRSDMLKIRRFLADELMLELHPQKVILRKAIQGIDFLGQVILPHRKVIRTKTKRRIIKLANHKNLASYKGMLKHGQNKRLENLLDARFSGEATVLY